MPETKITVDQLVEKRNQLLNEILKIRTEFEIKSRSGNKSDVEKFGNFRYFIHSIYEVARAYDLLDYSLPCAVETEEEMNKVYDEAMSKVEELKEDCLSVNGDNWQYMIGKWGR